MTATRMTRLIKVLPFVFERDLRAPEHEEACRQRDSSPRFVGHSPDAYVRAAADSDIE
ncbi:hypothetical protein [Micromonospora sp. NPDC049151]|uniref:hypothetical protein n=1 Tax=unclassified Micromonospora TaxID=2617518 RepID=UPI0034036E60